MNKVTIKDIPIKDFDTLLFILSGSNNNVEDKQKLLEKFLLVRQEFKAKLDEKYKKLEQQPTEDDYIKSANPTSAEHIK